jgi:small subunit ribosomal protein S6e
MFKINISEKSGKTYKLEVDAPGLDGKEIGSKIDGSEIVADLNGYELEITGASDKSGFPSMQNVEGVGLKRVLLTYGKGMKKRSKKEGKKPRSNPKPKGLRLRKTVRGKIVSGDVVQINLKVLKHGSKKLEEIFPDQNKPKEKPAKPAEAQ